MKTKTLLVVMTVLGWVSNGCAGLALQQKQTWSAGQIGCPAREIQVDVDDYQNWTASCRGHTYICSAEPTGGVYGGYSSHCKESLK